MAKDITERILGDPNHDIRTMVMTDAPPPDCIWPGFSSGTVGALLAPGGTGKSYFAMSASMAVAGGTDLLNIEPSKFGRVVYWSAEDRIQDLWPRIRALSKRMTQEGREAICKNFILRTITGYRVDLMESAELEAITKRSEGTRLIVLDTLSRLHRLEENDNGDMSQIVCCLEQIADRTGCSVLYLHHVSKSAGKDGQIDQFAGRGAVSLIDNSRWAACMGLMTQPEAESMLDPTYGPGLIGSRANNYVKYKTVKASYSKNSQNDGEWFQRTEHGVMIPVNLEMAGEKPRTLEGKKQKNKLSTTTTTREEIHHEFGENW